MEQGKQSAVVPGLFQSSVCSVLLDRGCIYMQIDHDALEVGQEKIYRQLYTLEKTFACVESLPPCVLRARGGWKATTLFTSLSLAHTPTLTYFRFAYLFLFFLSHQQRQQSIESHPEENLTFNNMQRLIDASLEGNAARVTALVDSAVNPRELVNKADERGFRALHIAVMMGSSECAKKLLEAGADPKASTNDGATPIVMAAQGSGVASHPEIEEGGAARCIKYLLDAGADQTERDEVVGTVPLHVAIYRGDVPGVFETLLTGPGGEVAVNTKDTKGATPLHIACRKKGDAAPEAMAMLREDCPVMVDVAVVDDAGRTPLADATHHGHAEVVKLLLAAGSDASLRDKTGMTPLSAAAWLGKEKCLDALLETESGLAAVDVPNNLGATPLIFACQENHKSIAEKLIAAGASLDAADLTGKTPYLIAKQQNASACLELLREKHGRPTPEEEKFNATGTYAAVVPLTGGGCTVEKGPGGGMSMSFNTDTGANADGPAAALLATLTSKPSDQPSEDTSDGKDASGGKDASDEKKRKL